MAQSNSLSQVNISEKTERERLVIAKEVVIKSLLPVVFEYVTPRQREAIFDKWYNKLLKLILDEKKAVAPVRPVAPQKNVVNMPSDKLTQKQMKMIWALAHKLNISKEQLEAMTSHLYDASHLSSLDKQKRLGVRS